MNLKIFAVPCFGLFANLSFAQDQENQVVEPPSGESPAAQVEAVPSAETRIPGPITDGRISPPAAKPEPIPFKVLSSRTQRMFVSEAPEISGLPQVTGNINVTVQLVEDPGLPDPPEPLPPLPIDSPAVQARIAEARARFKQTKILLVSAKVVDFGKTILSVHPNGQAKEAVTVVSSIDYNDFSGFATFNVGGNGLDGTAQEVRRYSLIMMIFNENTASRKRLAEKSGKPYQALALPEIPDDTGASYVVLEGDNQEALQAIADMHALYRVEGQRMHTSRLAREKAHAERKAYLLAHPAKPEDVSIQFWERNKPVEEGR